MRCDRLPWVSRAGVHDANAAGLCGALSWLTDALLLGIKVTGGEGEEKRLVFNVFHTVDSFYVYLANSHCNVSVLNKTLILRRWVSFLIRSLRLRLSMISMNTCEVQPKKPLEFLTTSTATSSTDAKCGAYRGGQLREKLPSDYTTRHEVFSRSI